MNEPFSTTPILEVTSLVKYFPIQRTMMQSLMRRPATVVKAVDDVSFSLKRGEVLALVGESGCGKTTIARMLVGLVGQTSGQILFNGKVIDITQRRLQAGFLPFEAGKEVSGSPGTREQKVIPRLSLKRLHQQAQMVFQDPYESLDPRSTIFDIVAEGLEVNGLAPRRQERLERVKSTLEGAGLKPAEDYMLRYPHELSGGQRQRVVIAGAMVLEPELLVADEPVSMLDVSIRADILNLLRQLRIDRGISILFITHDLGTVAYFADRLAVMYLGRIVEIGHTRTVLEYPQHPYTRALLSVAPVPNPRLRRERVILQGETPNPVNVPHGCRFHPRCPVAKPFCQETDPQLEQVGGDHQAACLLISQKR